ncbi:hypothetical protein LCGC14_1284330 [marine sediment metagenome]|uniref:ABC transporter substrate-binding protein n=1 Tax=marine sediment metagenome TaxID=412755 RepID=A0A0F9KW02_9ZZZZ
MTGTRRHNDRGSTGAVSVRGVIALAAAVYALAGSPGAPAGGESASKPPTSRPVTSQPGSPEVLAVLSSAAGPYVQAEKAMARRLSELGRSMEAVQLDELVKRGGAGRPGVRVYVAVGTRAAAWLHPRIKGPAAMAYCMVTGLAESGLLGRPGRGGVCTDVPVKAQFELIARALPSARAIGMLYRSKSSRSRYVLARARKSLPKGWRLYAVDVDARQTVAEAIEVLCRRRIDVVWTAPDGSVYNTAVVRSLLLAAMRRNRPVFGFSPAFVRAGALVGVGIDPARQGRRAAEETEKLLSAPSPSQPGVHVGPDYRIAVNLIVAEKLGIRLPDALVKRADFVFDGKGRRNR